MILSVDSLFFRSLFFFAPFRVTQKHDFFVFGATYIVSNTKIFHLVLDTSYLTRKSSFWC